MELGQKKINFLGDSITWGVGVSHHENIYLNRLSRRVSLDKARNYGVCGTRIAPQRCPSADPSWDQDFISRVALMNPDADVIVVFGGTNDFGRGDAPLGRPSDRTPETFFGACHTLILTLFERFPCAQLVFLTPTHRLDEDAPPKQKQDPDAAPLSAYVSILREVTAFYAVPTLDLFATSGIQPRVPILRKLYCPDGTHPNDAGHERIASRLEGFLRAL